MTFPVTQKEPRLERLPEAATAHGIEYEWKLAGLFALRAFKKGLEFELFSNVKAAKPLDDIVLRLLGPSPSIYFIQLKQSREKKEKHSKKKAVTIESLMSATGDFSLPKYFKWFSNLDNQSTTKEFSDLLSNTPLENLHLVLFSTKDAHLDIRKCQKHFPLEDLFHTSSNGAEDVFCFDSSCPKVWELFDEDDRKDLYQNEFLGSLKVFCNQAHSEEISKKIEVELADIFGKNAEKFLQPFEESLKQWSENHDDGYCLSNKIILGFFTQQLRKTAQQSVCQNLQFKFESLDDLRVALRAALRNATPLLCVTVNEAKEPGLRAAKVLQAVSAEFGDEAWLYVDGSILCGFKEEALISAVRSVKVIVHDLKKGKDVDLAQKLLASLERRSEVLEVAIQNAEKCDFKDIWQLQDLSDGMQKSMLERTVTFHGEDMILEDLGRTWPSMLEDIRADFITNKRELTIGKQIDESEEKMLDRCLSHHHEVSAKVISDKEAALKGGRLALLGFPQHILEEAARQLNILKSKEDAEKVVKDNARWTVLNFQGETSSKDCKESLEAIAREKSAPAVHLVEFLSGTKVEDVRLIWRDSFGKQETMEDFVLPLSKECDVKKPVCLHRSVTSLEDSKRSLLVGPAGCGKTTTISCFASQLQKECPTQWVILVKILKHQNLLRKWKDQTEVTVDQVVELLAAAAGAETGSARRYLESSIKEKGAISVFLDGVDEVAPAFEKITILLLKKLLEQPLRRVWVTTRTEVEASLRLVLQSPPLTLYPLTTEEQQRFIRSHLTSVSESEKDERFEKIMNFMAKTRDFLTTPLHLDMTCQIFNTNKDTDFESNFTLLKLYENFIKQKRTLYEEKFNAENLSSDNFEIKHQKCAVVFLFEDDPYASQLPIQEYIQYVANDESLLSGKEKFGFVWLDGESISFIHQTFAEYFAARWIFSNTKTYGDRKFVLRLIEFNGHENRIQIFLQDMLAEKWPLHAAAWRRDMKQVQRLMEERSWGREHWHEQDSILQWTWGRYVQLAYEDRILQSRKENEEVAEPWRCVSLIAAAENGCHRIVAELLLEGDFPPETLSEAMRVAAYGEEESHTSIVETLLKYEVEDIPNWEDKVTVLHVAVDGGNEATVALLVSQSANVNVRNYQGETPLHLALRHHNHKVLEILLREKSLDVDAEDYDGNTPLYYASHRGCVSCTKSLLCRGGNVDGGAHNPLIAAASHNNIDVLRFLFDNGASVNKGNKYGDTALHNAVRDENKEAIQLLIDRGADIALKNNDGDTALDVAVKWTSEEIVEMLLQRMGANALYRAVIRRDTEKVALLLKESASDFNERHIKGYTALHCAMGLHGKRHKHDISQMLLQEQSIDVEAEDKDGLTPLYYASRVGCVSCAELILNRGAKVDGGSSSPLIAACERNFTDMSRFLLDNGASPNKRYKDGDTALHLAVRDENKEAIQLLIDRGADIALKNKYGETAFDIAYKMDNENIVEILLQRMGANALYRAVVRRDKKKIALLLKETASDLNERHFKGKSALHFALGRVIFTHQHEISQMLLQEQCIDVEAKDDDGLTPLYYASRAGCDSCAELILNRGAKVDDGSTSPLIAACERNYTDMSRFLLDNGAFVNKRDENGDTALHHAVQDENMKVIELLIDRGADIALKNEDGETAFDIAFKDDSKEIVEILLQRMGASALQLAIIRDDTATVALLLKESASEFNERNITGNTALHFALGPNGHKHNHEISQMLLQEQLIDVEAEDEDGLTPLYYASRVGCVSCAELILNRGAKVNGGSSSPLIAACEGDFTDMSRSLCERTQDLNVADKDQNTALHIVARRGNTEVLKMLLDKGVTVDAKNKTGNTPLYYASQRGNLECVKFLMQYGADINSTNIDGITPLNLAALNGRETIL